MAVGSEPRTPFSPPAYEALRAAPWPSELEREFCVGSTHAFVALVNELRRAESRLPVPQGSFPRRPEDLERLVKEARQLQARQRLAAKEDGAAPH